MSRTLRSGKACVKSSQTPPLEQKQDSTTSPSFNGALQQFAFSNGDPGHAQTHTTTARPTKQSKPGIPSVKSQTPAGTDTRSRKRPQDLTSALASSPSPSKKRRESSKYAPPSKYAHLPKLTDILAPNLICVFVGTNPGIRTATAGHAYAHPSNLFWKLLYSSGCTDRRCRPDEDVDMPRLYAMGNTNIVERPTKDAAELSKREMAEGTPILEAKIAECKPEAVCIVGKGIWEAVWRYRHGRNPSKDDFKWGWQDDKENMGVVDEETSVDSGAQWKGAKVFVASSTSGLSASLRPAEKEAIWKPFGEWVKRRRKEREEESSSQS